MLNKILLSKGLSPKSIYVYEPDTDNYRNAVSNLSDYHYAIIKNVGVGSKAETLYFNNGGTGRSHILRGGEQKESVESIEVVSIDEDIKEVVTLIKMDLEGWESEALKGSKGHIEKDVPRLAISVYHKPNDVHELAKQIDSYYDGYKMYLRHYDENGSETILYCVK